MSGVAVGWVGAEGPVPDDLDRDGRPYGRRAQGFRAVLLAVASSASTSGKGAYPGVAGICAFSLFSPGHVRRVCGELVVEGWLIVDAQGGGRGRATVFSLDFERRSKRAHLDERVSGAESAHDHARVSGAERAHLEARVTEDDGLPKSAHADPETRARRAQTRASGCAPNGITTVKPTVEIKQTNVRETRTDVETITSPSVRNPAAKKPGKRREPKPSSNGTLAEKSPALFADDPSADDLFDRFYALYPRAGKKPDSRKAFARALRKVDVETIMAGLAKWLPAFAAREVRFVPLPSSWLNAEGWNDEPEPPKRSVGDKNRAVIAALFDSSAAPRQRAANGSNGSKALTTTAREIPAATGRSRGQSGQLPEGLTTL